MILAPMNLVSLRAYFNGGVCWWDRLYIDTMIHHNILKITASNLGLMKLGAAVASWSSTYIQDIPLP